MLAKAECEDFFAKMKLQREPEPAPVYTEKETSWAVGFLNTPSQYELHHKPDDYLRTLEKEWAKSKSSSHASGSKSKSENKAGANQVKVQGKQRAFPSSDNRRNNLSHPSRCYPKSFPRWRTKVWKKLRSWRPLWV